MIKLKEPSIPVANVINKCTSNYRNNDLSEKLRSVVSSIVVGEQEYKRVANNSCFYKIDPSSIVGEIVTGLEMNKLYNDKFVKLGQPGRVFYNELLNSAPLNICPYCLQRTVSTLDHYLPKSKFPVYAVSPINLVPSCSDCNKGKLVEVSTSSSDETLHPYYDDVSNDKWLYAKVLKTVPLSFEFYINPPESWPEVKKIKVKNHFNNFNLAELYITHAAVEYNNLKDALKYIYKNGGAEEVKNHLKILAISSNKIHKNSWKTALYSAMANDYWFCSNSFIY